MKVSLVNLGLIGCGILLLTLGVYRTVPLRFDRMFKLNNIPIMIMLVIVVGWALFLGRGESGLHGTLSVSAQFLPMLLALFPVMAFSGVVASAYQKPIEGFLLGRFGYPAGLLAGFAFPSSSSVSQILVLLWRNRALRPLVLYFLTISPLTAFVIFFIRQMGLGAEIAWAMYRVNIAVAIALMPVFWLVGRMLASVR